MKSQRFDRWLLQRKQAYGSLKTRRIPSRMLQAEGLESREMLSADGLAAIPMADVTAVADTVVVGAQTAQCDQTQDRFRLHDCGAQQAGAKVQLHAEIQQKIQVPSQQMIHQGVQKQNRDRIQDPASNTPIASAIKIQDQSRDRLQDRLEDGGCDQDQARQQDQARHRLQDGSCTTSVVLAAIQLQNQDRVLDRVQDGDGDQDHTRQEDRVRDRLQDGSCDAAVALAASQLQDQNRIQDRLQLEEGDCDQDQDPDLTRARDRIHQQSIDDAFASLTLGRLR